MIVYSADTATQLGGMDDTTVSSPKPPTKSVSWASTVTSSAVTSSADSPELQEIGFLKHELKEAMKENLEYVDQQDVMHDCYSGSSCYFHCMHL